MYTSLSSKGFREFMNLDNKYSQGKFDASHPTISQSFLNMWARCPFSAHQRYILGIIKPPGIAALMGTSLDAGATAGFSSVIETGKDLSLKDKRDIAVTTFDSKLSEHELFPEDKVDASRDTVVRLVDAHHVIVAPRVKPVSVQESVVVKGEEYDIAGTFDLREEGNIVADTKTAGKANQYPAKGFLQTAVYSVLHKAKYGILPAKFRFDVFVKQKEIKIERPEVNITSVHEQIFDRAVKTTLTEMKASLKSGDFRLAESGHALCTRKWCAYIDSCAKGKV